MSRKFFLLLMLGLCTVGAAGVSLRANDGCAPSCAAPAPCEGCVPPSCAAPAPCGGCDGCTPVCDECVECDDDCDDDCDD